MAISFRWNLLKIKYQVEINKISKDVWIFREETFSSMYSSLYWKFLISYKLKKEKLKWKFRGVNQRDTTRLFVDTLTYTGNKSWLWLALGENKWVGITVKIELADEMKWEKLGERKLLINEKYRGQRADRNMLVLSKCSEWCNEV